MPCPQCKKKQGKIKQWYDKYHKTTKLFIRQKKICLFCYIKQGSKSLRRNDIMRGEYVVI